MNQMAKRIVSVLIVWSIWGLAYEFIISPYLMDPLSKKIENIVEVNSNGKTTNKI